MKTEIEKLDQNIQCVENDILNQDEILSKLIELEDRSLRQMRHRIYANKKFRTK